tara:strand:+ start:44314 stop:45183 length:870 start_codon:yes stop_codon:yes gene_type:complete
MPDPPKTHSRWSDSEVKLIIADYFAMLEAEMLNQTFDKTQHRKLLLPQLSGRSKGSVEFKHQNISAVLIEQGLPYIDGYKPRGNYQKLLVDEIETYLNKNPDLMDRFANSPTLNPTKPKQAVSSDLNSIIEAPPDKIISPKPSNKPWLSRKGKRINFAERDAANRKLGNLGEKFVFELEQYRLKLAGRDDLAQKVIWASKEYGDGLGFDILSFDERTESERMLEVKSTGLGKYFPFFLTQNELLCSEDIPEQFHLYRVFDFGRSPRIFILNGSLRNLCNLDPVLYRATL